MMKKRKIRRSQAGFSLMELLVTVGLITVIMGAIFAELKDSQQSAASEQVKVDLFQEARGFMDQLTRDLRSAGFPNSRNFTNDPGPNSQKEAVGVVRLEPDKLWFEASLDGGATVSVVRYRLVQTGEGCPCLVRSQAPKVDGDPLREQGENETEVQNVMSAGTTEDPVFVAYSASGTTINTVKIDDVGGPMANINTVAITLKVRAPYADPKTHDRPVTTLFTTVRLNNCSAAYSAGGQTVMGCTGAN